MEHCAKICGQRIQESRCTMKVVTDYEAKKSLTSRSSAKKKKKNYHNVSEEPVHGLTTFRWRFHPGSERSSKDKSNSPFHPSLQVSQHIKEAVRTMSEPQVNFEKKDNVKILRDKFSSGINPVLDQKRQLDTSKSSLTLIYSSVKVIFKFRTQI